MAPLSIIRQRNLDGTTSSSRNACYLEDTTTMMVPLTSNSSATCIDNSDPNDLDNQDLMELGLEPTEQEEGTEHSDLLVEDDDEEDPEELTWWQRIPSGLLIALGLFGVSSLTCLRIVFVYTWQSHSALYALCFALAIAGAFGMALYIVGNTFWYNQLDLDEALEREERALALLSSVYPEHGLDRLLLENNSDAEDNNEEMGVINEEDEQPAINTTTTVANDSQSEDQLIMANLQQKLLDPTALSTSTSNPRRRNRKTSSSANTTSNSSQRRQPSPGSIMDASISSSMNHSMNHSSSYYSHNHKGNCQQKSVTDLYPDTTVIVATIVGFTAWSSQRSPDQVFELLETIFCEFDALAIPEQTGVFKVEASADKYTAVVGVPDADPHHALTAAKFASDCLYLFQTIVERLEVDLGPDTGELMLRVGLHSGPVTGGVLKGERSTFQLFGDTVHNAVLMEKSGQGNRIHMTHETAQIIQSMGKKHWVVEREPSEAGNTYWLAAIKGKHRRPSCSLITATSDISSNTTKEQHGSNNEDDNDQDDDNSERSDATGRTCNSSYSASSDDSSSSSKRAITMQDILTAKEQRLIQWTVDQLALMLKKIVARRQAIQRHEQRRGITSSKNDEKNQTNGYGVANGPPVLHYSPPTGCVLEEVKEMVEIPRYNTALLLEEEKEDYHNVELGDRVLEELTNFVSTVTTFYFDASRNPFHNFQHACQVMMSTVKMMQRIISPAQAAMEKSRSSDLLNPVIGARRRTPRRSISKEELNDHTYGITSDPLTQFAVVFAALIHDLDHPGVPNAQLVTEQTRLARVYQNRSISEQNSLDMAWDLLMDPSYQRLVRTICSDQEELKRFRQLLVQTVMATDIADADLRDARNKRWDLAFAKKDDKDVTATATASSPTDGDQLDESNGSNDSSNTKRRASRSKNNRDRDTEDDKNRKATIVLEHLLQASDIAHTMQHWEVFRKWNEKLFREMYLAYLNGRADKDPGDFWYKGEIGFFTFYIIPLAKKLKDCGVFGVSSDEYLNYAQNNLQIWQAKGQEVVAELKEAVRRDYGTKEKPKTRVLL